MTEITDRDVSEMEKSELAAEYGEACEQCWHNYFETDEEADRVHDRRRELWNEMKGRTDAEPPECPRDECEGRRWGQVPGDPMVCLECDLHLNENHRDLHEEIHAYWEKVRAGPAEA